MKLDKINKILLYFEKITKMVLWYDIIGTYSPSLIKCKNLVLFLFGYYKLRPSIRHRRSLSSNAHHMHSMWGIFVLLHSSFNCRHLISLMIVCHIKHHPSWLCLPRKNWSLRFSSPSQAKTTSSKLSPFPPSSL